MKATILIVEDESSLAELLAELLTERGYAVTLASDGRAGLERLREQAYDLVLTDIMMPIIDGIEMVRRMQKMPELLRTRVIAMTALPSGLTAQERRLVQGVLVKPLSLNALFDTISTVLEGN